MTSWKGIFKETLKKIREYVFTKDFLIFLVFVLISTAFWFVNMSGQRRTVSVDFEVEYRNFPNNVRLVTPLPDEIQIDIRDLGLKVLPYVFGKPNALVIDYADFSRNDSVLNFPLYKFEALVRANLNGSSDIVSSLPPISTRYYTIATKRLRTKLVGGVSLQAQYVLQDTVRIEPQWVEAFGPQTVLDTLRYAYVAPLAQKKIDKSIAQRQSFVKINDVDFLPNAVDVTAEVEMLTEKRLQIPIYCENLPSEVYLHLFPSTVEVTFSVGLSKFNAVSESDFQIMFDYNELLRNATGKQRVAVQTSNPFVRNLKVQPQEVEFLLEEN